MHRVLSPPSCTTFPPIDPHGSSPSPARPSRRLLFRLFPPPHHHPATSSIVRPEVSRPLQPRPRPRVPIIESTLTLLADCTIRYPTSTRLLYSLFLFTFLTSLASLFLLTPVSPYLRPRGQTCTSSPEPTTSGVHRYAVVCVIYPVRDLPERYGTRGDSEMRSRGTQT